MSSLIDALATRLPGDAIQLNSPVRSITRQPDGQWQLNFGFRISDCGFGRAGSSSTPAGAEDLPAHDNPQSAIRNPQSFDAVILALPAPAAARLLQDCDPQLATELSAISYAGCAVISLGFARGQIAHSLDGFGFVVPEREGRRIIAASFASLKYPGRAPADCVLIRAFLGGALHPELLQQADSELIQIALKDVSELLQIGGRPLVTDLARWPASMPQYHVGHLDRVARIEQLSARWPGLALAGNAYHGVGIPQCIASGHSAAERVAAT
jgi:oxygen-dependent protoporphyrinogen oxidase